MLEDNNIVASQDTSMGMRFPTLKEKAMSFNDFVVNARAAKLQQNETDNNVTKQNLFMSGMNTSDHNVANECNRLVRLKNVSDGLNDFFYGGQKIINEGEEMDFVQSWLDENQDNEYGQMAYDYIADDSNIDCDALPFYEKMGWIREEPVNDTDTSMDVGDMGTEDRQLTPEPEEYSVWNGEGNAWSNILGGGYDKVQNVGNFIQDKLDSITNWFNKMIGASDEEEIAEYEAKKDKMRDVYQAKNFIPGVDDESVTYWLAGELEELGALWGLDSAFTGVKGLELANKTKLLENIAKSKRGKRIWNMLKRGSKGATDMAVLDVMEGEEPTVSDMGVGALINTLLGGKFKNYADKNTAKGSMYKTQLDDVLKMLKDDYGINLDIKSLGEFINRRFSGGSKQKIAEQAKVWAKTAEELVDTMLGFSEEKVNSETTTKILTAIAENLESKISAAGDTISDTINKEAADEIRALIKSDNNYLLTEIKNAMRKLSDSDITPFKKNVFGETSDAGSKKFKQTLRDWYDELKKTLETKVKEAGLGDLENINKEIYTAKAVSKGLIKKDIGEQAANSLKNTIQNSALLSAVGGAASSVVGGSPSAGVIGGLVVSLTPKVWKKLLGNTTFRTKLSRLIYNFSGEEKQALVDWLDSEGVNKLSESAEKKLQELYKKIDKSWLDKNLPKILGGVSDLTKSEIGQELSSD